MLFKKKNQTQVKDERIEKATGDEVWKIGVGVEVRKILADI